MYATTLTNPEPVLADCDCTVDYLRREEARDPEIAAWVHFTLCREGSRRGWPIVHEHPAIQAHYVAMRMDGSGHGFAEMLALQSPPQPKSDREFFMQRRQGRDCQFEGQPWRWQYYQQKAREAGVDVTGATYLPELARVGVGPGDPEAWVRDLGEVRKRAEERGMGCDHPYLQLKAREPEDEPVLRAPPAADIVYERMLDRIRDNPDLEHVARTKTQEFFEETRESLKPKPFRVELPE